MLLCLPYEASQCRLLEEEEEAVLNKANDDLLLRFTCDLDPDPDATDPDEPLKHTKSLMIRPANPPDLSPLLPPLLEPHATLLGRLSSPNLPPSTSVYTTGIPPLHPPGILPTANPPPGNLQIVIPAEESPPSSSATVVVATSSSSSAGSSWRQTGQELRIASQGRMQSGW